ncbi:MAG: hypothetical protein M0025_04105, partial [Elusimicrobia bacterium]|nr:hypothetical protein [Elusimicrobiota bacterium]
TNAMYMVFADGYSPPWHPYTVTRIQACADSLEGKADPMLVPARGYSFSLADNGRSITASVDSKRLYSVEDSFSGGNYVALGSRDYPAGVKAYYDNVRVRKYADPEPAVYPYSPSGASRKAGYGGMGI